MKKVLSLLAVSISFFTFSQKEVDSVFDFSTLKYSYAKAFLYGLEKESGLIIKNGELNATTLDTSGIRLDSIQSIQVIQVVSGNSTGTQDEPNMCFIPHHGIVFYNENNEPIAHISICFYCETKYTYPKTLRTTSGMNILLDIIKQLGLPVFDSPEEYEQYGAKVRQSGTKN
jgi:hypothetical protein